MVARALSRHATVPRLLASVNKLVQQTKHALEYVATLATKNISNLQWLEANFWIILLAMKLTVSFYIEGEDDPHGLPKSMGIFQTVTSPKTITSVSVATRIIDNHEASKKRNLKKKASEDKYYAQKKFVFGDRLMLQAKGAYMFCSALAEERRHRK